MEKPDRGDKKYWRSQSNSLKDDKWFFKEEGFWADVFNWENETGKKHPLSPTNTYQKHYDSSKQTVNILTDGGSTE